VSSMRHLLSKCGTPVRLCADPTDVLDEVFDTGLARQRRQALALHLFPGRRRLQPVFCTAEDAHTPANAGAAVASHRDHP